MSAFDVDLFGNERPARRGPSSPAVRLNLFDAVAEASALASGRAVSQERAEVVGGDAACRTCGAGRASHASNGSVMLCPAAPRSALRTA